MPIGHLALHAAIEILVLEKEYRVGVADRLDDHALGIFWSCRQHDLQAGAVREVAVIHL